LTPSEATKAIEDGEDVWFKSPGNPDARGPIDIEDMAAMYHEPGFTFHQQVGPEEIKFGSYQLPGGENYRELLLTAPGKDWELVVGKWLGGFLLLDTIIAITLIYPLLLNQLVDPGIDQGPLLSGYLGLILLAASMVAVGVFVSSLFSNQIAAFVTTLGALIFLWWVLSPIAQVTGPLGKSSELISYLDYSGHYFETMVRGIIDLKDVVFYLSVTALALFLGSVSTEMRRWG
jgi:hypothetical protein